MEVLNRKSCRALIVNEADELLLIEIANPSSGWRGWIAPGGGMEEGETEDACLRRELREELSLDTQAPARKVWTRFHEFVWGGKLYRQHEDYFLLSVPRFDPNPRADLSAAELADIQSMRWWTPATLLTSSDRFGPSRLPELFQDLIANGPPSSPVDVGV